VNDDNFSKTIAWNGKKLATEEYSWDNVADKMSLIFSRLC